MENLKPLNRVKELREEKGFSQNELSHLCGCAFSTIAYYESQKRTPSGTVLAKLSVIFNVNPQYIRGESDIREFSENDNSLEKDRAIANINLNLRKLSYKATLAIDRIVKEIQGIEEK